MQESTFITDIYHINGDGKEGGTVYTKLLSREGLVEPHALLEVCRHLYPDSGYNFEASGLLNPLRSLKLDKIKEYHQKFYQPENVTIYIAGKIEPHGILAQIEPIERALIEAGKTPKDAFHRALDPDTKLQENVTQTFSFASDERVNGSVYIAWRGPNSVTDYKDLTACHILLDYLCGGPVSVLRSALVDADLVVTIEFEIIELLEALIVVKVLGVDVDKITEVQEKIFEQIEGIVEGNVDLNMERLKIVVQTFWERELNKLEEEPHLRIFQKIIPTIVYASHGINEETLESRFNLQELTDDMMQKSPEEWIELMNKYFMQVMNSNSRKSLPFFAGHVIGFSSNLLCKNL